MKYLLVVVSLFLMTGTAQAEDNTPSWEEIQKKFYKYDPDYPQYAMSHGYFLRTPSVCVDGEFLRSKKKLEKCYSWSGRDNDRCEDMRYVYVRKAIEGTYEVCDRFRGGEGGDCEEYGTYPYKIDLSPVIDVYDARDSWGGGDGGPRDNFFRRKLFSKEFVIPNCED